MDELNNLIDTGRFLKVMADIETGKDQLEPHQFKRDQILTPVEQTRSAILKMLHGEIDGDSPHWDNCISEMIRKIEGMKL